jgi:hypothetical protein
MALSLPTNSDWVQRTTNIVQASSDYTCVFWFEFTGSPSGLPSVPFIKLDNPAVYQDYQAIYTNATPLALVEVSVGGSIADTSGTPTLSTGTWYPFAYTKSGNVHSFYVSGRLVGSVTKNLTGSSAYTMEALGNDAISSVSPYAMRFTSFKEWNLALGSGPLQDEINSPSAVVHTSGLVTFTPLVSDLLDISGNGNDWTAVGSPTFVADPSFPTNLTSATATDVGTLPASVSQDATGGLAFVFTLWFKYAVQPADAVLSAFASGGTLSGTGYLPKLSLYNQSVTRLTGPLTAVKVAMQPTVGTTLLYLTVTPTNSSFVPAALVLTVQTFAQQPIPQFAPFIISDATDAVGTRYPAAVLDTAHDNTVLNLINFPAASENGTWLPGGTFCVGTDDETPTNRALIIDGTTYAVLHSLTLPAGCRGVTSNRVDTYYVMYVPVSGGHSGHYCVQSLALDGTLGATIFDLGASTVSAIGVSPDSSTLYYLGSGSTTVKRWNLNTNMALSDLYTGVAHAPMPDVMVSVAGLVFIGDPTAGSIKSYNAGGTLQMTYPIAISPITDQSRFCLDPTDAHLLVWSATTNTPCQLQSIKTSDGSTTYQHDYASFQGGESNEAATLTPTARFGPENSCPMLFTLTSSLPPNPFVGQAVTRAVVRIRQASLDALPGNTPMFLGRAEVQMQPGLGIVGDSAAVPVVLMIWSSDAGKTWGSEHSLSIGLEGRYYVRAYQATVGRVRQPVCRLTVSDDVNFTPTDLFITRESGLG